MKSLITILSVAALLASSVSAVPPARVKRDYDIDTPIVNWMRKAPVQRIFNSVCGTDGGWEGWTQVELEAEFKETFALDPNLSIREKTLVFLDQERADFVLPETARAKGMVIELKCENKNTQSGKGIKTPVGKDKDKKFKVKPAYAGYTFVALAMAYSPEADTALTRIGMRAIPNAQYVVPGGKGTMRAYKEVLKQLTADMEDFSDAMNGLAIGSRPSSPTPKKPAGSTPQGPAGPNAPANPKAPAGSKGQPPKKAAAGKKLA